MTLHSRDIESTANRRVKTWLSLSRRSVRDETEQFLIEGRRETIRALEHLTINELIWCPDIDSTPLQTDIVTTTVSRRVFEKISRRQNPDGIAAVTSTPDLSLTSFSPSAPALVLAADGIEKPGNIGAMFRTCDAFGAAFLGSSLGTDLVNPNVVRSAQGSLFSVPAASVAREEAIEWCSRGQTQELNSPCLRNVATIWYKKDPVAAGLWMEGESGLSAEDLVAVRKRASKHRNR